MEELNDLLFELSVSLKSAILRAEDIEERLGPSDQAIDCELSQCIQSLSYSLDRAKRAYGLAGGFIEV